MSSDDGTPSDGGRGEDGGKRRRRRRRKRPEGTGPQPARPGPAGNEGWASGSGVVEVPGRTESSGAQARDPGAPSSGDPGDRPRGSDPASGPVSASGERRRRRRRRSRDGRPEPDSRGPGPGEPPREPHRSGERRDPRLADRREPTRGERRDPRPERRDPRPERRDPRPAEPRDPARADAVSADDVDAGWEPAVAPRDDQAHRGRREHSADEPREEAWGDDSSAPTAEVALLADLPGDPPLDDPDPVTAFLDADSDESAADPSRPVRNLAGIKFTTAGKIYLFDAGEEAYAAGEQVVVDTERGPRIGRVAVAPRRQEVTRTGTLRRVLRRPSRTDHRRLDANGERAEAALRGAKVVARELGMPIKVFRAELSLGGGKALVYFSSDEKVDARRLVRDLSQRLRMRVELRQTGVRDEAKMVGGIGSCGQELCCTTWLPAFVPVSIKNAKDQGLVLNPTKVSGQCGRLKCCLVYEQSTYAELRRGLPKLGKRVVTSSGEGRVIEVDVLRQRVRVSLAGGEVEVFEAGEVRPLFPSQPGGRPGDQQA